MKRSIAALLLLPLFCLAQMRSGGSATAGNLSDTAGRELEKEIVKIYPNPTHNGTVQVVTQASGRLHFYIFDLEGTLVHQSVLKTKQKETVRNLKKGVYMYDVFRNDISIVHGKIIVK
jgi:O-acetyl-ADP-ribose deacetylase (regulator of RNase III)